MGKPNVKGGKKHKRGRKEVIESSKHVETADSTQGQMYGVVLRKLGGKYLEVKCSDGQIRQAYIRGALHKTVWMNTNDVLLLSLRHGMTGDKMTDINLKYTTEQIKQLILCGELSESLIKLDSIMGAEDDNNITFDDTEDVNSKTYINFDLI